MSRYCIFIGYIYLCGSRPDTDCILPMDLFVWVIPRYSQHFPIRYFGHGRYRLRACFRMCGSWPGNPRIHQTAIKHMLEAWSDTHCVYPMYAGHDQLLTQSLHTSDVCDGKARYSLHTSDVCDGTARYSLHTSDVCDGTARYSLHTSDVCDGTARYCIHPMYVMARPDTHCIHPMYVMALPGTHCIHPMYVMVRPDTHCIHPMYVMARPGTHCIHPMGIMCVWVTVRYSVHNPLELSMCGPWLGTHCMHPLGVSVYVWFVAGCLLHVSSVLCCVLVMARYSLHMKKEFPLGTDLCAGHVTR